MAKRKKAKRGTAKPKVRAVRRKASSAYRKKPKVKRRKAAPKKKAARRKTAARKTADRKAKKRPAVRKARKPASATARTSAVVPVSAPGPAAVPIEPRTTVFPTP